MQAVAVSHGVDHLSHGQFGLGVLGTDRRHDAGAHCGIDMVGHGRGLPATSFILSQRAAWDEAALSGLRLRLAAKCDKTGVLWSG